MRNLLPVLIILIGCVAPAMNASSALPASASWEPGPEEAGTAQVSADQERRVEYGFDLRIRSENWNNILDANDNADDERQHVRFRTRTWAKLCSSRIDIYVRVANEFRKQTTPAVSLNLDEVFFDSLYADIKKLPVVGLSLRVGRQDFGTKGEGLLFADGTAADGSRSVFFNGLDLSYAWKGSKLELIGIFDPRQERLLPTVHGQHKYLTEWDEQGLGLYYSDRNHPQTDVDGYFFHKKQIHDYRALTNRLSQPDRHLETAGIRVVRRWPHAFTTASEFAYEWGAQHPATTIRGWAFTSSLRKEVDWKGRPYLLIGYTGLSGDDPGTSNRVESWDPLFARYPKWSDLYLYSLTPERGVGYWSNLNMWQSEAGMMPAKRVKLRAMISRLGAWDVQESPTNVFGNGSVRGVGFLVRSEFALQPGMKVHLQYERLLPGGFYSHQAPGYFMRADISYEFKGGWGE